MLRLPITTGFALSVIATAPAQTFTSPSGFGQTEGDAAHFALFHPSYERFMQIDATQSAAAPNIRAILVRRDGETVSPSGVARTLDLTINMGHANYANIDGTFATNYLGSPTTVFARRQVNTPDWSQLTGATPEPFDLRVALDTPWSFNGNDALVFEMLMENVSQLGSPNVDRELGATTEFTSAFGTSNNNGCTVAGQGIPMKHSLLFRNYGPNHPQFALRIGVQLQQAPLNSATTVNFDVFDRNITLQGLCTTLHVPPGLTIDLGPTNAVGVINTRWIDLPYLQRAVVGRQFWSQMVSLDPSRQNEIPVALSDARTAVFPAPPRPSPQCSYVYAPSVTDSSATLWTDRGIIVQFEQ